MIRRNNGGKSVRRGSGEPYRHSDFRIAPCAHMRCRSPHCVSELGISRHYTTLFSIVAVVPTMETTVVGSRTLCRRAILCCIRVLLHKKRMIRARRVEHGPQLLDFSHILRLTIRAKESGRSLGLKSSSCKMTCCSRSLPVPPCSRRLLLTFLRRLRLGSRFWVRAPPEKGAVPVCSMR